MTPAVAKQEQVLAEDEDFLISFRMSLTASSFRGTKPPSPKSNQGKTSVEETNEKDDSRQQKGVGMMIDPMSPYYLHASDALGQPEKPPDLGALESPATGRHFSILALLLSVGSKGWQWFPVIETDRRRGFVQRRWAAKRRNIDDEAVRRNNDTMAPSPPPGCATPDCCCSPSSGGAFFVALCSIDFHGKRRPAMLLKLQRQTEQRQPGFVGDVAAFPFFLAMLRLVANLVCRVCGRGRWLLAFGIVIGGAARCGGGGLASTSSSTAPSGFRFFIDGDAQRGGATEVGWLLLRPAAPTSTAAESGVR
nr:uncharacterized protein LOC109154743 [Ipomoea batatas]